MGYRFRSKKALKAAAIAATDTSAAAAFRDVGKAMNDSNAEGLTKGTGKLDEIKSSRKKAIDDFETYCKS
jgi:hypothetical protein